VDLVVLDPRVEYVIKAVLPKKVLRNNPESPVKFISLLRPKFFESSDRMDSTLKGLIYLHEL
jgi:hypothetical protein